MSELIPRESFGVLLEDALIRFFASKGQDCKVSWISELSKDKILRKSGSQLWIGNIYTNAIFTPDCDRMVYEPLYREFSRSITVWKTLFQKMYVFLAFSKFSSMYMSHNGFVIQPAINDCQSKIIIPGNHKIRILDFLEKKCYSVMKKGYSKERFVEELKNRKLCETFGVPIPTVTDSCIDRQIMCEEIIVGTPLNRLPVKTQRGYLQKALFTIGEMTRNTSKSIDCATYLKEIECKVDELISKCANVNVELVNGVKKNAESLLRVAHSLKTENITIALSHGDFQPANILCENNAVWLIDWEYSGMRQDCFDRLVYNLKSRAPANLADRVTEILSVKLSEDKCVTYFGAVLSQEQISFRIILFLLEELMIRLYENTFIFITVTDSGLSVYVREVQKFLRCYKKSE